MKRMNVWMRTALAAVLAGSSMMTQAASLSGSYTADDYAKVYLSTDLVADASEIISDKQTLWGSTESFSSVILTPGQNYYLLVLARNAFGGPAMFVGDFALTGDGFKFSNGGQTLLTNTTNWTVNESGFGAAGQTPVSLGTNASLQIWGARPAISGDAEAVWAYYADWANGYNGPAYFVTQIKAVPEPAAFAMFAAGLGVLGTIARRRRV